MFDLVHQTNGEICACFNHSDCKEPECREQYEEYYDVGHDVTIKGCSAIFLEVAQALTKFDVRDLSISKRSSCKNNSPKECNHI